MVLSLGAMVQSVDLSSCCELLCYLIDPVGIERNVPLDLHNSKKRILVDGLLWLYRDSRLCNFVVFGAAASRASHSSAVHPKGHTQLRFFFLQSSQVVAEVLDALSHRNFVIVVHGTEDRPPYGHV